VGNGADGRRPRSGTRIPRYSSPRGSVSFTCLKWEHVIHPADLEKAARRAGFPIRLVMVSKASQSIVRRDEASNRGVDEDVDPGVGCWNMAGWSCIFVEVGWEVGG
jgi:hypothetical protein